MRNGRIFFMRKEKDIYDNSLEFVRKVVKGADFVEESIKALADENRNRMQDNINKTLETAHQCEDLYAEIRKKVMDSIGHPSTREDLLRFIDSLFDLSKAVEATAYRIGMCESFTIPEVLQQDLVQLSSSVAKTPKAVEKTVADMPFNTDEALEHSESIHKLEEKVDDIRRDLMRDLIRQSKEENINIGLGDFYIITEIIERLEDIADACDQIRHDLGFIVYSK